MNTLENASFVRPSVDEWYVYQDSGVHTGPLTLDALAQRITDGDIPRLAYAGFAGEGRWRPVLEIPEVVLALRALEVAQQVTAPSPSSRPPSMPRVPSSKAPPALPIGFATPPRVQQVASSGRAPLPPRVPEEALLPATPETLADETIPAPSSSLGSHSEARALATPPSPIPASLPPAPPAPAPAVGAHAFLQPLAGPAAPSIAIEVVDVAAMTQQTAAMPTPPRTQPRQEGQDKPLLDPRLRFLPFAIFGACALVAAIEAVVAVVAG